MEAGIPGSLPSAQIPGKDALLKTPVTPLEKVKAVAKDTLKGVMGHQDVEHFGTGKPQESTEATMEHELNELAKLAGLQVEEAKKPDADNDGIPDWADKNPNKAGDDEDRKTEEVETEGNAFGKAVRDAKADGIQPGEKVKVGDKEYPVKESSTTLEDIAWLSGIAVEGRDYGDTDVIPKKGEKVATYNNTPDEQIEDVDAIIHQGNDLNKEKQQDPKTANKAANPMAKKEVEESVDPLESLSHKLLKAYNSIKIQK